MPRSSELRVEKTPKHLWIVGVLALLWTAMGAYDYVMTQTRNEAYMSNFSPEQLEFFYGFPAWLVAFWAVAVWGGVVGSILLLLKTRLAVWAYLASLLAMAVTTIQNFFFDNGLQVMSDAFSLVFTAIIILVTIALYLYARTMRRNGILS